MNSELITDKLSFHVQSFQESFESLSNSFSLSEMAKQFVKILSGSFFTTNVNIYHRKNETSEWLSCTPKANKQFKDVLNKSEGSSKILSNLESTELTSISNLVDKSRLAILLGKKFDGTEYSEIDKITFQIFIQIFDSAYQVLLSSKKEKGLIFSLNNRVSQLFSLIDTGIEISKRNLGNQLYELALSRAISLTNSSFGKIRVTHKNGKFEEIIFPPYFDSTDMDENSCLAKKFSEGGNEYEFMLFEKESREGIISFDDTDELLLGAIAKQVQAAIENDRFHKEALENEAIKRELAVAAEIQKRILPINLPKIEGYDIAGINIPSKEVSGDYYNVFKLDESRYAIILADVAGKGMPASLLVSTLDASLRSYLDFQIPLPEMAKKINSIIYKSSPADKFITFFISVLNLVDGELDIINAGHNPALLIRKNNKMEKIDAGGVAFGMFDMGLPFDGQKLSLEKGERLFIFSDGIPEAMDKDEEEYSDEKFREIF